MNLHGLILNYYALKERSSLVIIYHIQMKIN